MRGAVFVIGCLVGVLVGIFCLSGQCPFMVTEEKAWLVDFEKVIMLPVLYFVWA